jgi:hypothetical protein
VGEDEWDGVPLAMIDKARMIGDDERDIQILLNKGLAEHGVEGGAAVEAVGGYFAESDDDGRVDGTKLF